jgi:hypothetical protein
MPTGFCSFTACPVILLNTIILPLAQKNPLSSHVRLEEANPKASEFAGALIYANLLQML